MNVRTALGMIACAFGAGIIGTLIGIWLSIPVQDQTVRVIDGDTFAVGETTYRLAGIDAPESSQPCLNAVGKAYDCSSEARDALAALLHTSGVKVTESLGKDQYGREIAWFGNVNCNMVERGFAWAYRKYSDVCIPQEDKARALKIGVFAYPNKAPWEFRNEQK